MMYPFLTLDNETEITHSELRSIDGTEQVRVYIERPVDGGFESAWCILPDYRWEDVEGISEGEIKEFTELLSSMSHLIFRFARDGGFENAAAI